MSSRRYKPGNQEPINVLKDIEEHAFVGDFKIAREMPQTDEDFVTDDVPYNLAFVESYYGDQSRIKSSPSSSRIEHSIAEEHGDELLAEGDSILRYQEFNNRKRHWSFCGTTKAGESSGKGQIRRIRRTNSGLRLIRTIFKDVRFFRPIRRRTFPNSFDPQGKCIFENGCIDEA